MAKSVILIGDSLRLHYEPLVAAELAGEALVWGPPENCGTSRNIRDRLEEWILGRDPNVIHLSCGLHDLRLDPGCVSSAVPPDEYGQNIEIILRTLLAKTTSEVVWGTLTPINETWHQAHRASRRFESDVIAYNEIGRRVAEGLNVRVNDLFGAVQEAGPDTLLKRDGVHFTDDGYRFLAWCVTSAIRSALGAEQRRT